MAQSLKRLLTRFYESIRNTTQRDKIGAGEQTTRYILSKRHFSASKRTVKSGAYLPAPNGETSVYRTSDVPEEEIWNIGREAVAKPRDGSLYARGDVPVAAIVKTGLKVVPDTGPHPRHANITGWPPEKDKQKMLAVEIADASELMLPSD